MKVELTAQDCVVTREPGDPRMRESGRCMVDGADSMLLYHVKRVLQAQGHDVIKKQVCRDGHLIEEGVQYVRSRKMGPAAFCVWNDRYQIESAGERFNRDGKVRLAKVSLTAAEGGGTVRRTPGSGPVPMDLSPAVE